MCKTVAFPVELKLRIGKALAHAYNGDGLALDLMGQLERTATSEKEFLTKASQLFTYASKEPKRIDDAKEKGDDSAVLFEEALSSVPVNELMVKEFLDSDLKLKRKYNEQSSISDEEDEGVFYNAKRFEPSIKHQSPGQMNKSKKIIRKKSVSFDESLEKICEIPPKECTWPYGSLYGDELPQVFSEFSALYEYDTYKQMESRNDTDTENGGNDCSGFNEERNEIENVNSGIVNNVKLGNDDIGSSNNNNNNDSENECFDVENFDYEKALGKGLLLKCGRIAKIVSATSSSLCAKIFVRFNSLFDKLNDVQKNYEIRPTDLIETDIYEQIDFSTVVSEVNIACVDAKDNDNTKSQDRSIPQYHYVWYFHSQKEKLVPYPLTGRQVRVYWPEDDQHYLAKITDISKKDGKFCLEYDIDGSVEYLNIVQLKEEESLQFI